jgi:predicted RNA binding protein YcfA (HicA-like mRNA interferase family)
MKVRIFKQLLIQSGFRFIRQGKGDHEIWGNDHITFPVDGADGVEIPTGTLRAYLRITGIQLESTSKKRAKN